MHDILWMGGLAQPLRVVARNGVTAWIGGPPFKPDDRSAARPWLAAANRPGSLSGCARCRLPTSNRQTTNPARFEEPAQSNDRPRSLGSYATRNHA